MPQNDSKLDELNDSDVLLPPQIALRIAIERRLIVVAVHHDVHDDVEEAHKEPMTTVSVVVQIHKAEVQHVHVMEDVQKGYLAILLSQHKEDRLQQIEQLIEEVRVRKPALPGLVLMIRRQVLDALKVIVSGSQHKVDSL